MSVHIPIRSIALAAPLLLWGASFGVPANAAPADDCLTAPKSPTPAGKHWYYHTDRKKGRKCWFLRDVNPPQQAAATTDKSAAKPATPAKTTTKTSKKAASTSAKTQAAPKPVPVSSAVTTDPAQQDVRAKPAAPKFPDPPAAQASTPSQLEPLGTAAPSTVPIIWPDLRPVETIKIRKPNSGPGEATAGAVPPTAAVQTPPAPKDTARSAPPRDTARSVAPTNKQAQVADVAVSPGMTPVQMALVVLSALAVAGLLYHLVIRIAASRRRRDALRYMPPVWADDSHRRPWRNEPRPQAPEQERTQPVTAREQFVDESRVSLVPAASEEGVRQSPRPTDAHRMYAPRKAAAAPTALPISEHENNLAQLIRDLDQLLQTRKQA